jgi:perosamine synthetase
MKFRKYYSPYYGSLSFKKSLVSSINCILNLFCSNSTRRVKLNEELNKYFPESKVFSFGSARSSLAFFLKSVGIGQGDEVILSAYTCLAVPTSIIATGAKPVYIDICCETLNMDTNKVSACITSKTKAIIVQHTLGKSAEIELLIKLAESKNILIIEDCALSIGTKKNDRFLGSFGDAAIISMELSKTITSGWGGILLINKIELFDSLSKQYDLLPEYPHLSSLNDFFQTIISALCHKPLVFDLIGKYIIYIGFISKLFRRSTPINEFKGIISNKFITKLGKFQIELALLQWRDFSNIISITEKNGSYLRERINNHSLRLLAAPSLNENSVAPRISFLVDDRRDAFLYFMRRGIELGEWFDGPLSPLPTTPNFNWEKGLYSNAENIAKNVVNLSCHAGINHAGLVYISNVLFDYTQRENK